MRRNWRHRSSTVRIIAAQIVMVPMAMLVGAKADN
jgi:hypothetical protein